MGHQEAVTVVFHATCFAGQAAGDHAQAQLFGNAGGDLTVALVHLPIAPAVELDMADDQIGALIGKKRACIARPEVFGGDIPQRDPVTEPLAGLCMIGGGGQHHHRFKVGDGIGDICDRVLQHVQKDTVGMDLAVDRPHHEGLRVAVFFGGDMERWRGYGGGPVQKAKGRSPQQ